MLISKFRETLKKKTEEIIFDAGSMKCQLKLEICSVEMVLIRQKML